MLAAYPPRGVIRLLPPENTWGSRPKIERLVAEEYIIDTIHYFDADRVACAKTLASGDTDDAATRLLSLLEGIQLMAICCAQARFLGFRPSSDSSRMHCLSISTWIPSGYAKEKSMQLSCLFAGLPLKGKIEPILTETIFSQMLRVPTPHLKPIAYATILVKFLL